MTKNIYAIYSKEHDMTFIMEEGYKDGNPVYLEVKGFYHGEPNDYDTKLFYGETRALYEY